MAVRAGTDGADAIPVLVYHSVSDVPPPDQVRYTVAPRRFAEHAEAIAASGREALTISELAAGLRGARTLPDRAVAVTFDDGFRDTPAAVATLAKRGIASTVYVTTGRMDAPGPEFPPSALRELAEIEHVELGAHTVSHPYLDELDPAGATREILGSRLALEDHLGRRVESFAYPHGAYERRVRAAVIAAGFSSAAAVKNALSHRQDDPFAIARWTVQDDTTTAQVAAVLDGRGAPMAWRRERHRTRAYRHARRLRRRLAHTRSGRP